MACVTTAKVNKLRHTTLLAPNFTRLNEALACLANRIVGQECYHQAQQVQGSFKFLSDLSIYRGSPW